MTALEDATRREGEPHGGAPPPDEAARHAGAGDAPPADPLADAAVPPAGEPTGDATAPPTAEDAPPPHRSRLAEKRALEDAEARRAARRRLAFLSLGLPVLAGLGYLAWTLFSSGGHQPQRQVVNTVTRVTLPPPPPPPPPPPKADPPPEPAVQPRVQEQPLQRAEPKPEPPKPQPTPQPPGPPPGLGLPTGPGGANPYGIGPGGGDGSVIGGGGGGGGGGGSRFGGYAGVLQGAMQRALQRDERTRRGAWRVTVRIWVGPGGEITRLQLVGSSGDPQRDEAIRQVLQGLSVQAPPGDMPQPIVARIDSRA